MCIYIYIYIESWIFLIVQRLSFSVASKELRSTMNKSRFYIKIRRGFFSWLVRFLIQSTIFIVVVHDSIQEITHFALSNLLLTMDSSTNCIRTEHCLASAAHRKVSAHIFPEDMDDDKDGGITNERGRPKANRASQIYAWTSREPGDIIRDAHAWDEHHLTFQGYRTDRTDRPLGQAHAWDEHYLTFQGYRIYIYIAIVSGRLQLNGKHVLERFPLDPFWVTIPLVFAKMPERDYPNRLPT